MVEIKQYKTKKLPHSRKSKLTVYQLRVCRQHVIAHELLLPSHEFLSLVFITSLSSDILCIPFS